MKEQNILSLAFIVTVLSTVIISSWFILNIINDLTLLFSENMYKLLLIAVFVCFILSIVLLKKLLIEIRYKIDSYKEKERNIRDIYLYNQLLDPPNTNN